MNRVLNTKKYPSDEVPVPVFSASHLLHKSWDHFSFACSILCNIWTSIQWKIDNEDMNMWDKFICDLFSICTIKLTSQGWMNQSVCCSPHKFTIYLLNTVKEYCFMHLFFLLKILHYVLHLCEYECWLDFLWNIYVKTYLLQFQKAFFFPSRLWHMVQIFIKKQVLECL